MQISYPPEADVYRAKIRGFLEEKLPPDWNGIGSLARDEAVTFAS
jgi:hypothetical protein